MRNLFDKMLETLHVELIKMGSLCEDAISQAAYVLRGKNQEMIDSIAAIETEIDQKERDIERLCMKLILQQQPVATDLRLVSAAMKMISDMERIGDQASDIAEMSRFINTENPGNAIPIDSMATEAVKMVTDAIDSFINRDLILAHRVIKSDDIIDGLFSEIKNDIIEFLKNHPDDGEYCLDMLMVAKYFERIGDHAANIAEWVEFSITGIYKGDTL
ncbi:MAG: phosphate signaling complex protein PhoU [Porcipelethomonas sp.]